MRGYRSELSFIEKTIVMVRNVEVMCAKCGGHLGHVLMMDQQKQMECAIVQIRFH